jgi:Ca2+-binding EF-hand superfamily protein
LRKIATEIYPGNVTDAEVEEMIRIADLNQDGGVDYQEFIDLMKRAKLI